MDRVLLVLVLACCIVITGCISGSGSGGGEKQPVTTPPTTMAKTSVVTKVTPVPTTVKPTPTVACSHPATGTMLLSSSVTGAKSLTVDNQNKYDAVITLRVSAKPPESGGKVLSFYLQANDQYTIHTIPQGSYTLWYKLGECWDPAEKKFAVNRNAERFQDILDYSYNTAGFEAKIYGVSDGNALTTHVSPDMV
jgi:hypothetical protein